MINENEEMISQDVSLPPCMNLVSKCIAVTIPNGFTTVDTTDAIINISSNVFCCVGEPVEVECTSQVGENCPPVTGTFQVIPVFLRGSLDFVVSFPIFPSSFPPCSKDINNFSAIGSVTVDILICYAPLDFPCPDGPICPQGTALSIVPIEMCPDTFIIQVIFGFPNICTPSATEEPTVTVEIKDPLK